MRTRQLTLPTGRLAAPLVTSILVTGILVTSILVTSALVATALVTGILVTSAPVTTMGPIRPTDSAVAPSARPALDATAQPSDARPA